MRFVLAVIMFVGATAFAETNDELCEKVLICGTYTGTVSTSMYSQNSTIHNRFNETIFLKQSQSDANDVLMVVAVTYKDGTQERHEYTLHFNGDRFDLSLGQMTVGTGECRFMVCFYDRMTANPSIKARGIMQFRKNEGTYDLIVEREEDFIDEEGQVVGILSSELVEEPDLRLQ